MKRRSIIVSECSVEVDRDGLPQMRIMKNPKLQQPLRSLDVEGAKKEARELLIKQRKNIRSINIDTKGNIHVVVWKNKSKPERIKIPGWRFKRPGVVGIKK